MPAKGEAPMAGRNAGGVQGRRWEALVRRGKTGRGGVAWRVRIRLEMEGGTCRRSGGNGPPSGGYGVAGRCGGQGP